MDVHRQQFDELLPTVLKAIRKARFVAIDLEFSGMPHGLTASVAGRRQTVEDRYEQLKDAAEKYQVLQLGICTVHVDEKTGVHVCRPFTFAVSPATDPKIGIDREYVVQASAMEFLGRNGFDFNALFTVGVPYLSHAEEEWAAEREARRAALVKEEIELDDATQEWVDEFSAEIQCWLDDPQSGQSFWNISMPGQQDMNNWRKKIVHQTVRTRFPLLTTVGKANFVQVVRRADAAHEKEQQDERRAAYEQLLAASVGLRRVVDALRATAARPSVLVGHNLFSDLVHLYATFVGPLPDSLAEFRQRVHADFPTVLDTKFLATCEGAGTTNMTTRLQTLWETLSILRHPAIEIHPAHRRYNMFHTHAHDAGWDALTTARVLVRFMGNYQAQLAQLGANLDGALAQRLARVRLVRFINRGGSNPLNLSESFALPPFGDVLWAPFVNRLRVNGTEEGLLELG